MGGKSSRYAHVWAPAKLHLGLGQEILNHKVAPGEDDPHHGRVSTDLKVIVSKLSRRGMLNHSIAPDGRTPLHLASGVSPVVMKFLIRNQANPNIADNSGTAALHAAVLAHDLKSAKEIAQAKGVDVNKRDRLGMTPLLLAADIPHEPMVTMLVEKKADIDARDDRFLRSAIAILTMKGLRHTVRSLRQAGANVSLTDRLGRTPMALAAALDNAKVLEALLEPRVGRNGPEPEHVPPAEEDEARRSIGRQSTASSVLSRGKTLQTLLKGRSFAVEKSPRSSIFSIFSGRSKVDDSPSSPKSTGSRLSTFSRTGRRSATVRLRKRAPPLDLNRKDAYGDTALMIATKRGNAETMQLLLEKKASCRSRAADGDTPLVVAIRLREKQLVEMLLFEGEADPEDSVAEGSPLSMAVRRGESVLAGLLARAGADANRSCPATREAPLRLAARQGDAVMVAALMDAGADPFGHQDTQESCGVSALMAASGCGGNLDSVKILWESYARARGGGKCDVLGWTSLMHAARQGPRDVLEFFDSLDDASIDLLEDPDLPALYKQQQLLAEKRKRLLQEARRVFNVQTPMAPPMKGDESRRGGLLLATPHSRREDNEDSMEEIRDYVTSPSYRWMGGDLPGALSAALSVEEQDRNDAQAAGSPRSITSASPKPSPRRRVGAASPKPSPRSETATPKGRRTLKGLFKKAGTKVFAVRMLGGSGHRVGGGFREEQQPDGKAHAGGGSPATAEDRREESGTTAALHPPGWRSPRAEAGAGVTVSSEPDMTHES